MNQILAWKVDVVFGINSIELRFEVTTPLASLL